MVAVVGAGDAPQRGAKAVAVRQYRESLRRAGTRIQGGCLARELGSPKQQPREIRRLFFPQMYA